MKTLLSRTRSFLSSWQTFWAQLCLIGLALTLSGCFSVVRFAKLDCARTTRHWSEEQQTYVTETTEFHGGDPLGQFGLYPTMGIRWQLLRLTWNWSPPKYYWQRRVALPLAWVAMLPGGVVDLVVDTVSLPWDWKYRGRTHDLVADEAEERAYRSRCVNCGKTSDGEFARCKRTSERMTADAVRYYGVCPDCVERVKSLGYYFE